MDCAVALRRLYCLFVMEVGRDDPLEVEALDRVILDTDREALHMRIQRRPPGHRPADQHAIDLEPEVVMQPPGAVPVHHEPPGAARR